MALDSRQKRMSVPGIGRPWMRSQDNDAALGVAWRQSVGNVYAGNVVGLVVPTLEQRIEDLESIVFAQIGL